MSLILTHYNYVIVIFLMMTGLYVAFSAGNLIKRVIGLSIFQTTAGLFYITLGKVEGGTAPILMHGDKAAKAGAEAAPVVYSNPLPHVLILTAIVVGVATLAVGLALAVRVREAYGSVEAEDLAREDRAAFGPDEEAPG